MSAVNAFISALLDVALFPLRDLPALAGLCVVSAAISVVMLLIAKATSDQARLRTVKRSLQACVYEVRLFGDDAGAIVRAVGRLILLNLTYLRLSLVPLLIAAAPLTLLLLHLDAYYGVRAPQPGEAVLLTASLRDPAGPPPRLTTPTGVTVETPAVVIPSLRQAVWRISAHEAGDYELVIDAGGTAFAKRFTAAPGIVRRPAVRPAAGLLAEIRHPAEPPLPADSGITSISIALPERRIELFDWRAHWIVVLLAFSVAFGLVLRRPLKVVL